MAITNVEGYEFRDAESLVKWVRWLLYAYLIVTTVAVLFGVLEHNVLTQIRDEGDVSEELIAAADASDLRQGLAGLAQFVVFVVCSILSLRWIYRADTNARALGAVGLDKSPKWAVGWYFVPFANFWKPYGAMKQIWQASANPAEWRSQATPALLGGWWALWVLDTLAGNVAFRVSLRAEGLEALIAGSEVMIFSDIVTIPLTLVFLVVVQRIHVMQSATAARVSIAAPPVLVGS